MQNRALLRTIGAFIAFMIGSGFATGQEILQFFSSYGYMSYGVLAVFLVGFLVVSRILLVTGYEHKDQPFDHFTYYCGERLGKAYAWLIPITLVLIVSVMISAAGTTMNEYFGLNKLIGTTIMAVAVVGSYLIGFQRLIRVVSSIGPVIIIFSLLVGLFTVMKDFGRFDEVSVSAEVLAQKQPTSSWILSGLLYISLCLFTASTYYTALGRAAHSKREAQLGAGIGSVVFILSITIMSTAILLNAKEIVTMEIPTLYLARNLSGVLAAVFSMILIMGMFSSCATMMWSACSRFFIHDHMKNQLFAVGVGVGTWFLGQFSFSHLIAIFYPFVGYAGLIYIGRVLWRTFK